MEKTLTETIYAHLRMDSISGEIELLRYLSLCCSGEVGELANVIKKEWRGDFGPSRCIGDISKDVVDKMRGEVIDGVNYLFMIGALLGVKDMEAEMLEKLKIVEDREWAKRQNLGGQSWQTGRKSGEAPGR